MGASWKDEFFVKSFRLAGDGLSDREIAQALGVPFKAFRLWLERKPALKEGLAEARSKTDGYADFRAFVYEKLPRKAQEMWDAIDAADKLPDVDATKRDRRKAALAMIDAGPVKWRQSLFLHALVKCNFIVSRACLKIGASPGEVDRWKEESSPFRKLVDGIIDLKKDFFESALIDLVRAGDSAATIFANRTLNRDRGYSQDLAVTVDQTVVHKHQVSVEELPADAKRAILEAMRRKSAAQLEDNRETVDAEIVEP